MDNKAKAPLSKNVKKKQNKLKTYFKTDRAILMVCISIAFLFWLFTKLSYTTKSTISIKVNYVLPADKILTVPPPDEIEMDLEASGWDLLYVHFFVNKINLDFNLTDNQSKTIIASTLKGKVSKQLKKTINILDIRPDNFTLNPEPFAEKEIEIILDNKIELAPQHFLKDSILIEPKKIKVKGPASIIRDINKWYTEPLIIKNAESSINKYISVKSHENQNITFNPQKVIFTANIESITQRDFEIEIEKIAVPDDLLLVLLPKKVKVSCILGLNDYDDLSADQIKVVADFSKINIMENSEIKLDIIDYPNYVQQIRILPNKAEYIIKSKK